MDIVLNKLSNLSISSEDKSEEQIINSLIQLNDWNRILDYISSNQISRLTIDKLYCFSLVSKQYEYFIHLLNHHNCSLKVLTECFRYSIKQKEFNIYLEILRSQPIIIDKVTYDLFIETCQEEELRYLICVEGFDCSFDFLKSF